MFYVCKQFICVYYTDMFIGLLFSNLNNYWSFLVVYYFIEGNFIFEGFFFFLIYIDQLGFNLFIKHVKLEKQ